MMTPVHWHGPGNLPACLPGAGPAWRPRSSESGGGSEKATIADSPPVTGRLRPGARATRAAT
eukprot:3069292-Rhodomonas_salina.1